jgi:hypothetical protein
MQPKTKALQSSLNTALLLAIISCLLFNPAPAQALGSGEALPNFEDFLKLVQNNQAGVVRGVYVPGVLALPVIQQPAGNAGYVSDTDGEITQFSLPSQFGNVGLLAHNNLSGRLFSLLAAGQEVRLVYGDGKVEYFVIAELLKFQALEPTSPYSSFRDLNNDDKLTAEQLFNKVYRGDRHVIFQTCIAGPGSLSWGRLFVIALPKPPHTEPDRFGWLAPR